jgi:hypothetical protein
MRQHSPSLHPATCAATKCPESPEPSRLSGSSKRSLNAVYPMSRPHLLLSRNIIRIISLLPSTAAKTAHDTADCFPAQSLLGYLSTQHDVSDLTCSQPLSPLVPPGRFNPEPGRSYFAHLSELTLASMPQAHRAAFCRSVKTMMTVGRTA